MKLRDLHYYVRLLLKASCGTLFFVYALQAATSPVVVALMVKNEATQIVATLEPLVTGGIDQFLIYDTGSTDGTQSLAAQYLTTYGAQFHVVEEPFIDFATSRNNALAHAERLFPETVFVLMPDAEWYLREVRSLLAFCRAHAHAQEPGYTIRIADTTYSFYTPRLLRQSAHIRFVGHVHEAPSVPLTVALPPEIYFEWRPSAPGKKKSEQRFLKDIEVLTKALDEHPDDPRLLFYLGQTYWALEEYERAYQAYARRVAVAGAGTAEWDEETFLAKYILGMITDRLIERGVPGYTWQLGLSWYLEAYRMRPHRAEPLIRIAEHYYQCHDMDLCYLFVRTAIDIPYPPSEIGFVEYDLYAYQRYNLLGAAAGNIGEYEIGEWAVKEALKARPHEVHLHNNLERYRQKKEQGKKVCA